MKIRIKRSPKRQQAQYQPQQAPQIGYPMQDPTQQQQGQEQPQEWQEQQQFAYGGQKSKPHFSLDLGHYPFDANQFRKEPFVPTTSIEEVPREEASIEAERGETLVRKMKGGVLGQFNIGGKPHSQGGTPLDAKPGDFIFSQTKKMAIGGPILELFGKNGAGDKKYVPADLAKQYDINKYQAILSNPDSDNLQKKTAEMMVAKFGGKLQDLAEVQEMKKGTPQGTPQIAKYGGLMQAQKGKIVMEPSLVGPPEEGYNFEHSRSIGDIMVDVRRKIAEKKALNSPSQDIAPKPFVNNNIMSNNIRFNPHTYEGPPEEGFNNNMLPVTAKSINYSPSIGMRNMGVDPTTPQTLGDLGYRTNGLIAGRDIPENYNFQDVNTWNSPSFNFNQNTIKSTSDDRDFVDTPSNQILSGFTPADKEARIAQLLQSPNYKEPSVFIPPVPIVPRTTYEDNSALKSSIQARANARSKYANMTMDGTRARANDYALAGQDAESIAQADAQTQNRNVALSNQAAAMASDLMNKYGMEKSQALTMASKMASDYSRDRTKNVNDYIKGIPQMDQQLEAKNAKLAWTNAMYRNQGFQWDPKKQDFIFTPNANLFGQGSSGGGDETHFLAYHKAAYLKSFPRATEDKAEEYATKMLMHQKQMESRKMGQYTNKTSGSPFAGNESNDIYGLNR